MVVLVIIWTIFALACSIIAQNKNMSGALWFCIGLLFGIFALAVVIFLPDQNN